MSTVKVSPKFQVVIPKEVRERMRLRKGQRMIVVSYGKVITLVPDRPLEELRGMTKGMDWRDMREKNDRV